ncbi:MAG: VOC family protein [Pseudohongiellaceae bacterium]
MQINTHNKLNYVEFPSKDIEASKLFFQTAFQWTFEDYGPDYASFSDQGLDGGFYRADLECNSKKGGALLIFYSNEIEKTQADVENAGGVIVQELFDFPGGRRFHFTEPSGNEFAVWTDI